MKKRRGKISLWTAEEIEILVSAIYMCGTDR